MAIDDKNIGLGTIGLDLRSSVNQVKKGKLTYALNAVKSGFDGQEVNYQNEPANENCVNFPEGYQVIGRKSIPQKNMVAFMLVNPSTGGSEIGYVKDNNCLYIKSINDDCLAFDINKPIHKIEVKVTSTT